MVRLVALAVLLGAVACGTHGPEGTNPGDCADNADNDRDGRYDCEDDGCSADAVCVEQARMAELHQKRAAEERQKAFKEKRAAESEAAGPPFQKIENLLVQRGHNGADINFAAAKSYCDQLNLANMGNWRLPTRDEALKMVESGQLNPESYVMWTSTMKGKKRAIIVGITSGAANDLGVVYDGQCRARCVRDATK